MQKTALVIIDVQQAFDEPFWGERNNPDAEKNIAKLLAVWREKHAPIVHISHHSTNPDSPLHPDHRGNQFKPEALPIAAEPIFAKTVNSAFIGTELEHYLRENQLMDLVIVGLTTDHCVSTTTRMAANLGFNVTLVADATATFAKKGHNGILYSADDIHHINLASLHEEFCTVKNTDSIIDSQA